jgi:hypothetical protein
VSRHCERSEAIQLLPAILEYFVAPLSAPSNDLSSVMPALVAGIHVFTTKPQLKTWMAGTSPAIVERGFLRGLLFPTIAMPANCR